MVAPVRPTRPLRRTQLSDDVAAHLRGAVMSGRLRPGEFVRLDETAAELGVSVTPVREALLTLRGEGMVESVPNRGYVVSRLAPEDVHDIFWLQGQITVELAVRASRSAGTEDLTRLGELNDVLRDAVTLADPDRIADAEYEFHRELCRIAGGPKLAWFLLNAARYTPYRLYAADPAWGELAVRSHTSLIEAIRVHDRDAVVRHTRIQFDDAAERLVAHLGRAGIWT
ncbi:GntR family transcriptional regulator [Rhodococcus sp. TAF43]|uniref:GntR family transcriptional regulator n=1 Tax=unclassified Rhodococcus (in: high G+C Gram-positive bacteria) TaxID=192944 RepID=UPI000E0A2BF6|nr:MULTISPECIES: GntR family transcriptional regulator [unclassified Rhodococcus (in: high G+C Gram-positive bacteria)]QKT09765.1 GntR family transcriptional regulator [Rhodococcus sp. W8901]RDI28172.1 DNA-binding GntR family transcriptional regulator [Rhodococcus sp. AG1013]